MTELWKDSKEIPPEMLVNSPKKYIKKMRRYCPYCLSSETAIRKNKQKLSLEFNKRYVQKGEIEVDGE